MGFLLVLVTLHFIYYIPFFFLFLAFMNVMGGRGMMIASMFYTVIFAAIDFYMVYANFNPDFLYCYLIVAYIVSISTSLILWIFGKLDLSIWLLFSVVFSPISLPFTFLFVYLGAGDGKKAQI